MMKKVLISVILVFACLNSTVLHAYNLDETRIIYDKFYTNLSKKVPDDTKKIKSLEQLSRNIEASFKKTKNVKTLETLRHLRTLNNKKIIVLKSKLAIQKDKEEEQKVLANTEILEPSVALVKAPAWVQKLAKTYPYVSLNNGFEYSQDGKIYRISISKYYKIEDSRIQEFIDTKIPNAMIVWLPNGQYVLTAEYQKERKYSYEELKKLFVHTLSTKTPYILKDDGSYYGVKYEKYYFFEDTYGVYLSDLPKNGIDITKTLFIESDEGYRFASEFQNIRIVDKKIVDTVTNPNNFLEAVLDDNRFFPKNYDEILKNIQSDTLTLTKNLQTDEEKIYAIHKFVVERVEYYQNYGDGSKQIFSWVLTYQNKSWVCDGYTKLMLYMLSFAGIKDVEIKKWFAYDYVDFPNFWHAWVRVGNWYYDPTFDDPIGSVAKEKTIFSYYKMPRELLYVNRFDGLDIPSDLKNMSLEQRKQRVLENMYGVFEKYKDYAVMNKVKNRMFLWAGSKDVITVETLIKNMKISRVKNFTLDDGRRIAGIRFYPVTQSTLESLLNDPNTDFSKMTLLQWELSDGKTEYRLAYEIQFH